MVSRTKKSGSDKIYTPAAIAAKMVAAAHVRRPKRIADFAAGEGALLVAAKKVWPKAKAFASDISPDPLLIRKRGELGWTIGRCNFLNPLSRASCSALRGLSGAIDVILLNPPFSCRGGTRYEVVLGEKRVKCGQAFAFVLNAIRYLSPKGAIVCLLPRGSLASQRDAAAREHLSSIGRLAKVHTNWHRAFAGHVAKTAIVVFRKGEPRRVRRNIRPRHLDNRALHVGLVRGCTPVHSIPRRPPKHGLPLIHTSELQDGKATPNGRLAKPHNRSIAGPAVILPRIGRPTIQKASLYLEDRTIVLSDCVYALSCSSQRLAKELQERIVDNWKTVAGLYGGTGAPYMTVRNLLSCLAKLNVVVDSSSVSNTENGGKAKA